MLGYRRVGLIRALAALCFRIKNMYPIDLVSWPLKNERTLTGITELAAKLTINKHKPCLILMLLKLFDSIKSVGDNRDTLFAVTANKVCKIGMKSI